MSREHVQRLLTSVAEPDTPEERDEAWNELERLTADAERLRTLLADALPWLVVPSDVPEQHWETLGRVRDEIRTALEAAE